MTSESHEVAPAQRSIYRCMPKQYDFVTDDTHREILYSGAFGAGKSRALCFRALRLAQHPGARIGLCRKTSADLKASTLLTLLEPDGDLPEVLPPEACVHHRIAQRIRIIGGGEIVYFGFDSPTKVASRPLTDVLVDEGIELDEDEYTMLLGRIRVQYTRPDGTLNRNSIATATNPGPPTHFLHDRFFDSPNQTRKIIQTNTAENWHLPKEYIQSLSELKGQARQRFYEGLWVAFEGAVYWMFDPEIHCVKHPASWSRYVAGVDWGFQNPCVIRVHGVSTNPQRSHVVYEHYRSQMVSPEFAAKCSEVDQHFGRGRVMWVVDPSAADVIAQMRRLGLTVTQPPQRDAMAGIRVVQAWLAPITGPPRFTMDPGCEAGNKEYTAYRWNPRGIKEAPVKEKDHALDADRYALVYTDSLGSGTPKVSYG